MAKVLKSVAKLPVYKELTEKEFEELMKDWVPDRDKKFRLVKGSVDWESEIFKDEIYSPYILTLPVGKELLREMKTLGRNMLIALGIRKIPEISITSKCSSAKVIKDELVVVGTFMLDDPKISRTTQLDIYCGAIIHEACHILYTKWGFYEFANKFMHSIWNVIEDEYIERRLADEMPGFIHYVNKLKYYLFEKTVKEDEGHEKFKEEASIVNRLFMTFLRFVRYPAMVDEDEARYFGHYLLRIKKELKDFPKTSDEVYRAAVNIYEIFKELMIVEMAKMKKGDGDGESSESDVLDIEIEKEELEELQAKADKELESSYDTLKERLKQILIKAREHVEEVKGAVDERSIKEVTGGDCSVLKSDKYLASEIEGKLERSGDVFFEKVKGDKTSYNLVKKEIEKYVPVVRRELVGFLNDYEVVVPGMRIGELDESKIVEGLIGVETIYRQIGEVKTDKLAVVVLVDESGSMRGERISAAKSTAILINESLKGLKHVNYFVYGHTADVRKIGSVDITIYSEHGYEEPYGLSEISAKYENRDGAAIKAVINRVRTKTDLPMLMFVISDGAPCAEGYKGTEAMEDTRKAIEEAERKGIHIVGVAITAFLDPSTMYKHYIKLTDLNTLAKDLGKTVKKAILSMTKKQIVT